MRPQIRAKPPIMHARAINPSLYESRISTSTETRSAKLLEYLLLGKVKELFKNTRILGFLKQSNKQTSKRIIRIRSVTILYRDICKTDKCHFSHEQYKNIPDHIDLIRSPWGSSSYELSCVLLVIYQWNRWEKMILAEGERDSFLLREEMCGSFVRRLIKTVESVGVETEGLESTTKIFE